ncbi:hypothetical protein Goshw_026650 [Gossypium schwendimanii]|uniref:Uncharacterized protein n=1 Tax=Gossypium schwendimanii TaxID=34291 RepID=A0A7J9LIG6_GOSSC|nr:hypothetical protein [Gossypium schwendimanii]
MEAEASQVYTRKLFRMFQNELVHAQEYVADRVGVSDAYDFAIRGIKSLLDKLDDLVIVEIDEAKKSISIDDSIIIEDDIILRDPVHAVTKGHPTSLRKTSSIEESNKKSKTLLNTILSQLLAMLISVKLNFHSYGTLVLLATL